MKVKKRAKSNVWVFIGIFFVLALAPSRSYSSLYVKSVTGDVKVLLEDKSKPVSPGEKLEWGSVIRAGENSYAVLSSPDGSEMVIYPMSQVRIEPSVIESRPRVVLSFGVVFHKVARFFSRIVSFRTFTPSAVCGVRGTQYFVEAGVDGSSLVYVKEGEVEVRGRVLKGGEALEVVWSEGRWKEKFFKVRKYRPGMWFKKHSRVPRGMLKRLFPKGVPSLEKLKESLREAVSDGSLVEGRAADVHMAEKRVSVALARLDLLRTEKVKAALSKRERLQVARAFKEVKKANAFLRKLPDRTRREIERELRLMNVPPALLHKFLSLSPQQRRELVKKLRKWKKLTPEQRRRVVRNYTRFHRLPVEERRRIIENYKRFKKLPPEKRREILKLFERWKKLPPEKKKEIKRKFLRKKFREQKRRHR